MTYYSTSLRLYCKIERTAALTTLSPELRTIYPLEERQLSSGQVQLAMAEGGPSRGKTEKPRAQSIWGGIPNLRKSIIKNRWRKHSDDANSRTATILPNPHLDDTLLQTIPGSVSSVTVENPYVEQVDKDSATAQDPGEDIPNILNVDGLDEQNSSILTDGYRQSKLTAKVVKILTIVFLFSVILVCATLSKLCLVAITTQMHHALTVNFPMQPANNPFDDWPEDTDRFNDTTDSETELTRRNAQQSMNSTVRITKQQQSIAFIQVVIVLMASQLVTFLRMMFGGIIGKSSATYPWPSIGAIALVSLHTHTCTYVYTCTHTYTRPCTLECHITQVRMGLHDVVEAHAMMLN